MSKKIITLTIFMMVTCSTTFGTATAWDNGGSGYLWDTNDNWDTDNAPTSSDDVWVIAGGTGPTIQTGVTANCNINRIGGTSSVNTMTMTGGTYTGASHLIIGEYSGSTGILNLSGGTLNAYSLWVGGGATGILNMTGGTINLTGANEKLYVSRFSENGTFNLDGGTVNAKSIYMSAGALDLDGGTLIIDGDVNSTIASYVSSGYITANNGGGTVLHDYNITNAGKTTVTGSGGGSPPAKATTPTPANAATAVDVNDDLFWAAVVDANNYNVYFGTSSPGSLIGNQDPNTYEPGTMDANTLYYWRIDANNVYGATTGDVWSFTTAVEAGPPAKATTPTPANAATAVDVNDNLFWAAVVDANNYNVYFGTSSPGSLIGNQDPNTYEPGTMDEDTVYYWRIDANNVYGATTGDVWSFTTAADAPSALGWDDGGSGHLWSTSGNWNPDDIPGSTTDITIYVDGTGPTIDATVTAVVNIIRAGGTNMDDNMTMTGGTLTTSSHLILGESSGSTATLTMSGGTINADTLWAGNSGHGYVNMTGGTINISSESLYIARFGTGDGNIQFDGGTITAPAVYMAAGGLLDFEGGTLILDGDDTGTIASYISSGYITAYDGGGTVDYDYNTTNAGKTTVTGSGGSPPSKATTPSPANSATGVDVNDDLFWATVGDANNYNVYFGTSSPGSLIGNQDPNTYEPGTMDEDTVYYWRIDANNVYGATTGDVWSFTTAADAPNSLSWDDGGSGHLWSTAANWNPDDIPSSTNDVTIYYDATGPTVDSTVTATANTIRAGGTNMDDNMTVTGGTLTTSSHLTLGENSGSTATLTMSGGTINAYSLWAGNNGDGYVNMTGGTINITDQSLYIATYGSGDGNVQLDGGTITAPAIDLSAGGLLDIEGGTLILDGNDTSTISSYVSSGYITAYEGGGTVICDYNTTNPGKTTVTGGYNSDIVIDDFEGVDYNDWDVTGSAFGPGPAQGTQPGQGGVTGYEGDGLVNTFYTSDVNTGTLTSSSQFEIERKYLNFLIGGGNHPNETCINLIVDEEVVETATGLNDELLKWKSWDLSELQGEMAELQIVDNHTGGWGHINIDFIVQSSKKLDSDYIMEVEITKRYLNFPVQHGVDDRLMKVIIDGNSVREFEIELADGTADYWVFLDVNEFTGEDIVLQAPRQYEDATDLLQKVTHDNEITGHESIYNEVLRGQFHFSSKRGWNNDTNGMVYYNGLYHMFYQHNPYGCSWGNMTWGHAVSTDMVHWTEWPDAIHPDEMGTIYSGSAVVDSNDTAGFKTGTESPIVCFYTSAGGTNSWSQGAGFTQSIAYSNDGGQTFTKYQDNPVIEQIVAGNRDPKVFWYEPTDKWVMVLFTEVNEFAIYDSNNLKQWTETSTITPFYECPELFELPVDGNESNTKWVLYGANGNYKIGAFDGNEFDPETELLKFDYGNTFYASQTFNNEPNGRRVQMAWGRVDTPNMPFNQCVMFPVELTLHSDSNSILMFANPIDEIESLYVDTNSWYNETIDPEDDLLDGYAGDLWDIEAVFDVNEAETVGFDIRGTQIIYDVDDEQLTCAGYIPADVSPQDGKIHLRVIVDVATIEVFANEGEIYMAMKTVDVDRDDWSIGVFTTGGSSELEYLHVRELESIWP